MFIKLNIWEDKRSTAVHDNSMFSCVLVALNKCSLIFRVMAVDSQLASYNYLLERHKICFVVLNFNCLSISCFKWWMHIEIDFFK